MCGWLHGLGDGGVELPPRLSLSGCRLAGSMLRVTSFLRPPPQLLQLLLLLTRVLVLLQNAREELRQGVTR